MANPLLERISKQSNLFIGIGVILILMVLLVPMPPRMLDLLIAFNLLLSFIILLAPIYILQPSEFSSFPGVLLVITLYRLSLNVASTRAILGSTHNPGSIITTFGKVLIGSEPFVGLVIFIILFIINFVVINKGSTRIAEVAARFTLDAMPGKQMAIDADLNNGVINEQEARARREGIRRDADFYGAMDGASKFVKGDAVAGLIILFINIIGGFAVGMIAGGSWQDVLKTYTILTVGDGLVSSIPALLVSTSAGLIVTRSGAREDMGHEVVTQLLAEPKALYMAGIVVFMFGFIIWDRFYMFWIIGALTVALGYYISSSQKSADLDKKKAEAAAANAEKNAPRSGPEDMSRYLTVDPLELEIGYSLISLIDDKAQGDLLDRISNLRKGLAMELGVLVPPIRIRDNITLSPNQYVFKIRGEQVSTSECLVNHLLALNPGTVEQPIRGIATTEPAFGLPAIWVTPDKKEIAEMHGYTVIEPAAMIATHLSEVVKQSADRIITRQDVQKLLDNVKKENAAVVTELVDNNTLSVGAIEQVLKNLLHEGVPIRDLTTILETLADYAPINRDTEILTEYVRYALARTIARRYTAPDGVVYGMALGSNLEKMIADVVNQVKNRNFSAILSPQVVNNLYKDLKEGVAAMNARSHTPVLIVSPGIRSYMRKLVEPSLPHLPVISYNEIPTHIPINTYLSIEHKS